MPDTTFNYIVVGGGVVGLSISRELVMRGFKVAVFEKEKEVAEHTSGRNSGVIHSGVYYKPETQRAKLIVEAGNELIAYCQANGIPIRHVGKLIVAYGEKETKAVETRAEWGEKNGVKGLRMLHSQSEISQVEPNIIADAALHVPGVHVLDPKALTSCYKRDIQALGGRIFTGTRVRSIRETGLGFIIYTNNGVFSGGFLINAAGVHAADIAHQLGYGKKYAIIPFRGDYLEVAQPRNSIVNGLVYPAPGDVPFLGVHFTRHVDNSVTLGPNAALAPGLEAYGLAPKPDVIKLLLEEGFWKALLNPKVRAIAPGELLSSIFPTIFLARANKMLQQGARLHESDVSRAPERSGIRAQLVDRKTGELINDPVTEKGLYQLHILNAVSPAMTLSLGLARHIVTQELGLKGDVRADAHRIMREFAQKHRPSRLETASQAAPRIKRV